MTDINLKTLSPDTSLPTTGFLFGADSQASTNPSVYSTQTVATTLLGSTSLTGGPALTADAPVLNLTQEWSNGSVAFTGIRYNVTNTNSAAASLLMDLQIGGTGVATVTKSGNLTLGSTVTGSSGQLTLVSQTFGGSSWNFAYTGGNQVDFRLGTSSYYRFYSSVGFVVTSESCFGWGSATPLGSSTVPDTILTRKNTRILQLGAADAATALPQTLSVQSVVAGTTDGAGQPFTFTGSQSTGTGVPGNILIQTASSAATTGSAQNALATVATFGPSTLRLAQTTPALDLAQTWNTSGTVTGLKLNATDTASNAASLLMDLQVGATSKFSVSKFGTVTASENTTANTLAQRNGTNAQTFRVYNTYTDASNYERLNVGWEASGSLISFTAAGTGNSAQTIRISSNGAILNIGSSGGFVFGSAGANWWSIPSSGNLTASTDNTYDIGAVSATRPRSVYAGTSITPGRGVTVAGLPTPSTGMIARVTDALAPAIGTTVAGGGAAYALVNYNGANWTVIGV
jgi:hypothetical protein